jgi:hypothetical protein
MCLYFRRKTSKKEAEASIKTVKTKKTVYKIFVVNKKGDTIFLRSPYLSSEYHLGQRYISIISFREDLFGNTVVEQGIHSFHRKNGPMRNLNKDPNMVLIPCIIPAGGKYLIGKDNEIVSDTLVLPDSFIYKGEEYNINY